LKTTEFVCRYFAKDTWQISGSACDCYLLIGEKEAVMIDAGSYDENIREFAQTLTEKPVNKVINTHSHFDHTGGNGYFQQIFATEGISRSAKKLHGRMQGPLPVGLRLHLCDRRGNSPHRRPSAGNNRFKLPQPR